MSGVVMGKNHRGFPEPEPKLRRLSRREALKQLSALAVGSSAFVAAGCSSDAAPTAADGVGQSGASGAATPAAGSGVNTGSAGMSATGAAGKSATPAGASGSAGASGAAGTTSSAGASGAAAGSPGTAGASGAPNMTSTAGSPAAGSGGAGGAGSATSLDSLQCIATPAMDEGPFFIDEKLDRSNLTMGETRESVTKGVPLHLVVGVYKVSGMMCMPLSGVQVDIWHADAIGEYSDIAPGVIQATDTRGKNFLRGFQKTDAQGMVAFDTVYPGWYMSRTIHIHFKLRMLGSGSSAATFTSQMYFDEAINAEVLVKAPYSGHAGRTVLNDGDHIYNGTASNAQKPAAGSTPPGKNIMPTLVAMGPGYSATLKIGLMM
jgi:protocatechuate 3,4-dioxygenase beta subunit